TEKLKLSLRQLNDRIEEAKRKKNILIARQKRAEAHKRIQETMSSIGDKSVFETFERMTEQIEHEERKLIAAAEVNEDLSGDTLVKQFQSLEVKADADQQLLDLKRKLGLLPAGSSGESKQLGKGAAEIGAIILSPVVEQTQALISGLPQTLTNIQNVIAAWASEYPFLRNTELANPASGLVAGLINDATMFLRGSLLPYVTAGGKL